MGFTKHGTGDLLPPGDEDVQLVPIVAESSKRTGWTEKDDKALGEENEQADAEA